jgi:hypothetical protein
LAALCLSNYEVFQLICTHLFGSEDLLINAYYELVSEYDYNINVINQKITQPSDYNYSDDELAFLPYFTYLFSGRSEMQQEFILSITRAWGLARKGTLEINVTESIQKKAIFGT